MNIMGCPVKLSSQGTINFPVSYLQHYGVDIYADVLIRQECDHHIIFRIYQKRGLLQDETVVRLRAGNTYLPEQWLHRNGLIPGKDSLYLVGIDDGLVVSVSAHIKL